MKETITLTVHYTDGTMSDRPLTVKGSRIDTVDRFINRVRDELDSYRAMGVRSFTFRFSPVYAEVRYLDSINRKSWHA